MLQLARKLRDSIDVCFVLGLAVGGSILLVALILAKL